MSYTIIDSDHYYAAGIETMFFPGGEPHVKVPPFVGNVLFVAKCRTWIDVGFASLVASALQHQASVDLDVFLPYFPGARQDRSDGSTGLTARMVAQMFDGGYGLHVFDPHSDEAEAELCMPEVWTLCDLDIPIRRHVTGIIAPDKGAVGRATAFRDTFYPRAAVVCCTKELDPATGRLSKYVMPPLPWTGHYIVVDDICDGGGTFNLLADAWSAPEGSTLELIVSHGIFSMGLSGISHKYSRITTTNSWCRLEPLKASSIRVSLPVPDRLDVLPLEQLYGRIMGEQQ